MEREEIEQMEEIFEKLDKMDQEQKQYKSYIKMNILDKLALIAPEFKDSRENEVSYMKLSQAEKLKQGISKTVFRFLFIPNHGILSNQKIKILCNYLDSENETHKNGAILFLETVLLLQRYVLAEISWTKEKLEKIARDINEPQRTRRLAGRCLILDDFLSYVKVNFSTSFLNYQYSQLTDFPELFYDFNYALTAAVELKSDLEIFKKNGIDAKTFNPVNEFLQAVHDKLHISINTAFERVVLFILKSDDYSLYIQCCESLTMIYDSYKKLFNKESPYDSKIAIHSIDRLLSIVKKATENNLRILKCFLSTLDSALRLPSDSIVNLVLEIFENLSKNNYFKLSYEFDLKALLDIPDENIQKRISKIIMENSYYYLNK
jgi:hypothetical protein